MFDSESSFKPSSSSSSSSSSSPLLPSISNPKPIGLKFGVENILAKTKSSSPNAQMISGIIPSFQASSGSIYANDIVSIVSSFHSGIDFYPKSLHQISQPNYQTFRFPLINYDCNSAITKFHSHFIDDYSDSSSNYIIEKRLKQYNEWNDSIETNIRNKQSNTRDKNHNGLDRNQNNNYNNDRNDRSTIAIRLTKSIAESKIQSNTITDVGVVRKYRSSSHQFDANTKKRGSWSRAVFTTLQRICLEKHFGIEKYISKPDRQRLAEQLDLTDAQVKVWFQVSVSMLEKKISVKIIESERDFDGFFFFLQMQFVKFAMQKEFYQKNEK